MKKPIRDPKSVKVVLNGRPVDCRRFTGYKPCLPGKVCGAKCVDFDPIGAKILIVNLDAMGNVLVTTSILPAIKRKYPTSRISWITLKNAAPLLLNNLFIDEIYSWEPESRLILQHMTFDAAFNVDKSRRSGAFIASVAAEEKLGFGLHPNGCIIPLNKEAEESYALGLDDHVKFHVNKKTVQHIQCEEFRLDWRRDPYVLELTEQEKVFCVEYKKRVGIRDGETVVGFNTGCSELYPNKKLTIDQHVRLIRALSGVPNVRLVLVGGPEDTERNAEIARIAGGAVVNTPTTEGLRRGLCYENICDVIVTGDSFGMHAAIGLKKFVIAWFGVTCPDEIDLYDRGVKIVPAGLDCSPCWKRQCPYDLECIRAVDLDAIRDHVERYAKSSE
ncbi:MAG: lipopolysaccharide heptosyltransferase family protein [Candidatus Krumholzibacteria bacterium]|nr:lipopolysaccharide heptosyltransferase family protein [Candidatus Krumholzibacteria bacterium]